MSLELSNCDLVVLVCSSENIDLLATGQLDCLGVGGPVGGWHQNLVTLVYDNGKSLVNRLLATVCDSDLRSSYLSARVALGLLNDCILEFWKTRSWGVSVVFGVANRQNSGLYDVCRGGEVWLTSGVGNDVFALGFEGFSLGVDL